MTTQTSVLILGDNRRATLPPTRQCLPPPRPSSSHILLGKPDYNYFFFCEADVRAMISGTVQTGPGPKQRRHRLAKACEPCRRRRVKCNQELPCGACARARDSLACSYRDFGDRSSLRSPAEARAADGLKDVPRRGRPSLEDNGHQLDTSQDHTVDIEVLGRQKQDSAGNRSRESEQPGLTNALQHSGSSVPPVRPRLRHVPDKTKIFGQTHWIHTADKVCGPATDIMCTHQLLKCRYSSLSSVTSAALTWSQHLWTQRSN